MLHADPVCVKGGDHAHSVALSTTSVTFCFDGQSSLRGRFGLARAEGDRLAGKDLPRRRRRRQTRRKSPKAAPTITVCHHDGSSCRSSSRSIRIDRGINFTSAVNASGTLAAIAVSVAYR